MLNLHAPSTEKLPKNSIKSIKIFKFNSWEESAPLEQSPILKTLLARCSLCRKCKKLWWKSVKSKNSIEGSSGWWAGPFQTNIVRHEISYNNFYEHFSQAPAAFFCHISEASDPILLKLQWWRSWKECYGDVKLFNKTL